MSGGEAEVFLDLAHELADAARPIAMRYFRRQMTIESKDDESPVTIADRQVEAALRRLIEAAFPDHGILGEEMGAKNLEAEYVWILDPIDGTQSFATGKPLFATLIALLENGRPILGLMDAPAVAERWVGMTAQATTFNGERVTTRACEGLDQAWLYATSPEMFPESDFQAFEHLRHKVRRTVYGAEACAYGYLANGYIDLVCEATMQPYDYLPLVRIVEGAGGVITDWQGDDLSLESDGRVLAAESAELHRLALAALAA